jgi:hypothetical protein
LIEATRHIGIMLRLFLMSLCLIGAWVLISATMAFSSPISRENRYLSVRIHRLRRDHDAHPIKKREDDHNPPTILKDHWGLPTCAEHLTLPHPHGTDLDHFSLSGFQSREDIPCWSSLIAVYPVVEPLSGVELQELA